jgi:hypothetical protein
MIAFEIATQLWCNFRQLQATDVGADVDLTAQCRPAMEGVLTFSASFAQFLKSNSKKSSKESACRHHIRQVP